MSKTICALLATWLLAGCAASAPVDRDFLGNAYPPQCRDVSDIDIPVRTASVDEMRKITGTKKANLYSVWLNYTFKQHEILIREGLSPERYAEVLRHELCHEKMWQLTGDGNWHPK